MLTQHQARDLLFIIPWRALCISLTSLRPRFLSLFPSSLPVPVCMYLTFLLSEGSSGLLGLPDPAVLWADVLQLDHAPIHGGG
jgi:hypothetical protein